MSDFIWTDELALEFALSQHHAIAKKYISIDDKEAHQRLDRILQLFK